MIGGKKKKKKKKKSTGQLNDPCSVARRHRGWMLQINARILPLAESRGRGGEREEEQGRDKIGRKSGGRRGESRDKERGGAEREGEGETIARERGGG